MSETARHARICRGCWDQRSVPIPIRGPLAVPFRTFGISRSKMNPNICTICERAFRRVFPIRIERHAEAAVTAALEIQQRCTTALADPRASRLEEAADPPGVGVGIHTGQVELGEFSTVRTDFTAIGDTVNLAARLEARAAVGEILISAETAALSPDLTVLAPERTVSLKGIDHPVRAHVLIADPGI